MEVQNTLSNGCDIGVSTLAATVTTTVSTIMRSQNLRKGQTLRTNLIVCRGSEYFKQKRQDDKTVTNLWRFTIEDSYFLLTWPITNTSWPWLLPTNPHVRADCREDPVSNSAQHQVTMKCQLCHTTCCHLPSDDLYNFRLHFTGCSQPPSYSKLGCISMG